MIYIQAKDLKMMKLAEEIADGLYDEVQKWDYIDKKTIGIQMINAVDSVGANIAESHGRFHLKDSMNFSYYSRASIEETKFWLRRALSRQLINKQVFDFYTDKLNNLAPQLNAFINAKKRMVKS